MAVFRVVLGVVCRWNAAHLPAYWTGMESTSLWLYSDYPKSFIEAGCWLPSSILYPSVLSAPMRFFCLSLYLPCSFPMPSFPRAEVNLWGIVDGLRRPNSRVPLSLEGQLWVRSRECLFWVNIPSSKPLRMPPVCHDLGDRNFQHEDMTWLGLDALVLETFEELWLRWPDHLST